MGNAFTRAASASDKPIDTLLYGSDKPIETLSPPI